MQCKQHANDGLPLPLGAAHWVNSLVHRKLGEDQSTEEGYRKQNFHGNNNFCFAIHIPCRLWKSPLLGSTVDACTPFTESFEVMYKSTIRRMEPCRSCRHMAIGMQQRFNQARKQVY